MPKRGRPPMYGVNKRRFSTAVLSETGDWLKEETARRPGFLDALCEAIKNGAINASELYYEVDKARARLADRGQYPKNKPPPK